MGTRVKDLQGQRTMTIDAQENTVFIDADDYCYEIDRGILLRALSKELGSSALACLVCKHALMIAA